MQQHEKLTKWDFLAALLTLVIYALLIWIWSML
jgi:hypothetical protein